MPDILHALPIAAPPERIFDAVATAEGLASWWTSLVTAEPRVGSMAIFGFAGSTTVFRMRVDALDRPRRISWHCVGDHPEWKDAVLTFDLKPQNGETLLRFTHAGWRAADGWIGECSYTWAHVLARLKAAAETGEAMPYFA
jgi:uncharacterized protein YndB with AHSA1/START domain